MNRKMICTTLLVFLITMVSYAGDPPRIIESLSMPSNILGEEVRFSVVLPADYYQSEHSYPVVYLLHGLGDDETSWLEYGRISQFADRAEADGEIVPMIFVMPQGFRTYYVNDYKGSFRYQDMFVEEFVPYIDQQFRTLKENKQRALMGYSMGGFGAFNLAVRHPEVFGVSVPLSMSVRTDAQYMTEDPRGWDEQWGRLFGAPGEKDSARLTPWYLQNSPFHIPDGADSTAFRKIRLYMDNGDKEQTLCRANETLHILMEEKKIPHEFRVREGGHSFDYWCSALPDALRFISDAFEEKPYRGDFRPEVSFPPVPRDRIRHLAEGKEKAMVVVPEGYDETNRRYPILFLIGFLNETELENIAALTGRATADNAVGPMILAFLPVTDSVSMASLISKTSDQFRVRSGFRMKVVAGTGEGAPIALSMALVPETFGGCLITGGTLFPDQVTGMLNGITRETMKRTPLFVDAPCHGKYADGNGSLHMLLRDREIYHEYRVREGDGSGNWLVGGFPEMIRFAARQFHR